MSKNHTLASEMKDLDLLAKAVQRVLGSARRFERHTVPAHLYGYKDDQRKERAHLVIRRHEIEESANDMGFIQQPDGTISVIISQWDSGMGRRGARLLADIEDRYQIEAARQLLEQQGYVDIVETESAGEIKLTATGFRETAGGGAGGVAVGW